MSVATELPPTVFIPERARRIPSRAAAATTVGTVPGRRSLLKLVPPVEGCRPEPSDLVRGSRRSIARISSAVAGADNVAALPPRPAAVGAPQRGTRALRLTRRGVVAVVVGVVAAGGLLLFIAHLSLGSGQARPVSPSAAVVTVQPGDTLWSIAGQVAPGRDPRLVIERIRRSNHLNSVSLTPGQTLKVG